MYSLFTDYRIYAFPNSGGWYDFGFLLEAMMFLGGGGAGSKKVKKKKQLQLDIVHVGFVTLHSILRC